MNALRAFWCRLAASSCRVDAYLAHQRGEAAIAADWECRAMDWDRQEFLINLNRGMK